MVKRGKYFTDRNIFIFLFIFALVLRIMFANGGIPHFDSISDANRAPLTMEEGKLHYSYGYGSPGLVLMITAVYAVDHWTTGATNAEFAYFFITFITAALSISMLYLVVKKITKDKLIGFLAAMFLCVTPIYLSITTYPKAHAPGTFFSLLAGYYLLKAKDDKLKYLIISGLLFSIAISARLFSFVYIFPFALLYADPRISFGKRTSIKFNRNILKAKNIFLFLFCVFIIVFIMFIPQISRMGFAGYTSSVFGGEKKTVAWQGLFSKNLLVSFKDLTFSITWLGWAAVALGLFYFFKKDRTALAAFLLWFLMFLLWYGNLRVNEPRFITPVVVVLTIFMAAGCCVVYHNNKLAGILAAAILVVWMFMKIYPVIDYRHDYSGQKEFALWVGSVTEDNSILVTTDEGFFYTFYTGRATLSEEQALLCDKSGWIGHYYAGSEQDVEIFINKLHNCLQKGHPVYIAEPGIGYDPDKRLQEALMENFDIFLVGSKTNEGYYWNTLQLQLYEEKLFRVVGKGVGSSSVN